MISSGMEKFMQMKVCPVASITPVSSNVFSIPPFPVNNINMMFFAIREIFATSKLSASVQVTDQH